MTNTRRAPSARSRSSSSPAASPRTPSGALVLGAIASVQLGSALAATMFARIGPAGTVLERAAFGAIVLLVLARPRATSRSARELMLVLVFGLVLGGMNLSFYEALHRIPLGVAVAIEFVGPLAVAVAGSRRPGDLLCVALAAAGILALTRAGARGIDGAGVALALLAGCLWGAYILLNARIGQAFEGVSGLALAMCVASLALLGPGVVAGGARLLSASSLLLGAAVGVLSTAIPYSLETEALRRIPAPVFGVLMSLEPAMAALAGLIVLGQHLTARELAGIALVIVASVAASRRARTAPVAV